MPKAPYVLFGDMNGAPIVMHGDSPYQIGQLADMGGCEAWAIYHNDPKLRSTAQTEFLVRSKGQIRPRDI